MFFIHYIFIDEFCIIFEVYFMYGFSLQKAHVMSYNNRSHDHFKRKPD